MSFLSEIDIIWLGTLITAIGVLAALFVVYSVFTVATDPMAKRIKALNQRSEQLKAGLIAPVTRRRTKISHKNKNVAKIRVFLSTLQVLQQDQINEIQKLLAQAGIRSKELAVAVIFGRLVLPIAVGAFFGFLLYVVDIFPDWETYKRAGLIMGALILGYKAPDMFIQNKRTKRTDAISKGLPDALDLAVICVEAGLTIDAAFARVSKELGRAYPELAEELTLTSIELSFLTERRQAFDNMAYRINLESVKSIVTTMIQTEKYGTPLASALRVLSAEFRNDRMMRAETKAARLPAIMTIPLIVFILPVLFIVILGPASCSLTDNLSTSLG